MTSRSADDSGEVGTLGYVGGDRHDFGVRERGDEVVTARGQRR